MAQQPRPNEFHHIFQLCAEHHRKYVAAMLAGGFISFLPGVIEPNSGTFLTGLPGFPSRSHFVDFRRPRLQPVPFVLTSSYWINPATYWETDETRGVHYRTRPASDYRAITPLYEAHAIVGRKKVSWRAVADRGDRSADLGIHHQLYLQGREANEPAQAFLTCEDVAALRVYVWIPPRHWLATESSDSELLPER